jgi:hypothetical protein
MRLADIYHHVLRRSPSPEAAKIAISEARRDARLPLYCAERRERRAQPGLRLRPEDRPPELEPEIVQNCELPQGPFNHWDWERSYATSRDPQTHSLYEYDDIYANDDDVLRIWPLPAHDGLTPTVRAAIAALDNIEQEREHGLYGMRQEDLRIQVAARLGLRSIGLRILQTAVEKRRRRNRPNQR